MAWIYFLSRSVKKKFLNVLYWWLLIRLIGKIFWIKIVIYKHKFLKQTNCRFLGQIFCNSMFVLSIIYFSLFQLVSDNDNVLIALFYLSYKYLKNNITIIVSFWKTLVNNSKQICIIIIGTDKMNRFERKKLS